MSMLRAGGAGRKVPRAEPRPARLVAAVGACQGCGACLLTCPTHAIRPRGGALVVRAELCTGCGDCVEVCPVDAVELIPADRKANIRC